MKLGKIVKEQFEKYQLHILFFFDSSNSYEEEIDSWSDPDILPIKVDGQFFTLKYKLEYELKDKKVLLYFNKSEPNEQELEEFPLADLLFANKQLHLDPVMSFIEEYNLPASFRSVIDKYYHNELRHKNRREYLISILSPMAFSEAGLRKGLLCYHLGLKRISDNNIIAAQLFNLALNPDTFEESLSKIKQLDLNDILIKNLSELFGDVFRGISLVSMKELASRLKYNLIMRTINKALPEDKYNKLKEDNPTRLSRLNSLQLDWENEAHVKAGFQQVLNELGSNVKEDKIIEWYGSETKFGYYTSRLKQQIIEESIKLYDTQPAKVKQVIKPWLENPAEHIELIETIKFVWHANSMNEILLLYTNFIYDRPIEYINRYTQELYQVDFHYRKANEAYASCQKQAAAIDLDKAVKELHKRYEEEFVNPFNFQWMQCLKLFNFRINEIPVSKQHNFYKEKVASKTQKTAVIISDGLRYEIARELTKVLSRDPKNNANIDSMLTSIPSVTSLGMANLLPHNELKIQNPGYTIDGISTERTLNRSKILQKANSKSEAIDFSEIVDFDQEKGREYFKQREVVYIYHNKIDARGEKIKTEKTVFEAVKETIDDIGVIIRKLSAWNVYRILITADHGFILSLRDVPETMKEDLPEVNNEFLISNRVVIGKEIKNASYKFNLSDSSQLSEDMIVALPKSVNRFRRQGSGMQYVHGGASIQEMLVPVIEYSRLREETAEKVKIRLLKFEEKITSVYLRLKVLQLEPIGAGTKEMEVIFGLYSDTEEPVSNEIKQIFNFTSIQPSERMIEIILTLSAKGSQLSSCTLKAFDTDDEQRLNPIFNQRIFIQTIIQRDEF